MSITGKALIQRAPPQPLAKNRLNQSQKNHSPTNLFLQQPSSYTSAKSAKEDSEMNIPKCTHETTNDNVTKEECYGLSESFDKHSVAPRKISALILETQSVTILCGNLEYPNGATYKGEIEKYLDNKYRPQGTGIFRSPDGVELIGTFDRGHFSNDNGTKVGKGIKYEGTFRKGFLSGKGKITWPNGIVYEGEVVKDQPHGTGVLRYAEGEKFVGTFVKGHFSNGKGIIFYKGFRYEGTFIESFLQDGGSIACPDGASYTGKMQNNKPQGYGITICKEYTYLGDHKNGFADGRGILTRSGEKSSRGTWRMGVKQSEKKLLIEKALK